MTRSEFSHFSLDD